MREQQEDTVNNERSPQAPDMQLLGEIELDEPTHQADQIALADGWWALTKAVSRVDPDSILVTTCT